MLFSRSVSCAFAALAVLIATAPAKGDAPEPLTLVQHGKASFYADHFSHKRTASGARLDQGAFTAASPNLPMGTKAKVTNLATGKTVEVHVNDRGPHKRGRILDVSKTAANSLGIGRDGVVPVKIEVKPEDQPTPALRHEIARRATRQKQHLAEW